MLTAIIFIIILGVLVLVHEAGHFVMAKRAGMRVDEFGFGFPPKLFSITRGETRYSINLIPFGGFVKIMGEDGEERETPRSFTSKSAGSRALVIAAGVLMNLALAIVLLSFANLAGLRVGLTDADISKAQNTKVQIIQVDADSPAAAAGLQVLDEIVGFNENGAALETKSVEQVQNFIKANKGREITLEIRNGTEIRQIKVTPRLDPPPEQGALGISLALTGIIRYPWYEAIYRGVENTYYLAVNTAIGYGTIIKNLFIHGNAGVALSGPVGIAVITGQAAKLGFTYLMQFTALISVNLAILNVIPFPALDGGRLLFLAIEKIRRRPIAKKVEGMANAIGFGLLILLMVYVTSKDVINLFK